VVKPVEEPAEKLDEKLTEMIVGNPNEEAAERPVEMACPRPYLTALLFCRCRTRFRRVSFITSHVTFELKVIHEAYRRTCRNSDENKQTRSRVKGSGLNK
jgi:hypothetical protein